MGEEKLFEGGCQGIDSKKLRFTIPYPNYTAKGGTPVWRFGLTVNQACYLMAMQLWSDWNSGLFEWERSHAKSAK
eukprot:scaffold1803_cov92-Amphora_coffeaeformis.AAC.1